MRYKTMYGLHEARMWASMIGSGILAVAAIVASNPELREAASEKWEDLKGKFKKKPKEKVLKFVIVDKDGNPL